MKQGWKIMKLGDLCSFERGLTYSKGDEADLSTKGVLRSNNVDLASNTLNFDEIKYLKEDIDIPVSKKVKRNSLLMCMSNGSKAHLGKVAIVEDDLDYAFGGFMGLLIPNEEIVFPRYFYYALITPMYKLYIKGLSDGANINNLKFADLKEFDIPVPSLSEQQRIVALLDAEFAKIDALKANAEKNLQNAKDLYSEVLKRVLMTHNNWNSQILDDVCTKIVDGTHNSPVNSSKGDYMYVTAKNIKTWGLDLSNITYVTSEIHSEIYNRCNPEKGDVLYIKDGATTGIAIVNPISDEFSLLSSVALLKPRKDVISGAFLCYAMNSPMMYQFVREQMDGAAITRITLKKIKSFTISYPSLEEQNKIVSRLDTLNEKCKALQANYEKTLSLCDDLKQALLRKAFNGEI